MQMFNNVSNMPNVSNLPINNNPVKIISRFNNVARTPTQQFVPTPLPSPPPVPSQVNLDRVTNGANNNSKATWGEPTWFLFHTLAQKVKEENFQVVRNDLLSNVISICHNLPCPKCAKHATAKIKRVNFNSIQTKEDLKKFLFMFHNDVNRDKGYPIFEYDKLDEKYDKANTVKIIHYFMSLFNVKDFNVNMINSNLHRNMLVNKLKVWFKENIQHFDM